VDAVGRNSNETGLLFSARVSRFRRCPAVRGSVRGSTRRGASPVVRSPSGRLATGCSGHHDGGLSPETHLMATSHVLVSTERSPSEIRPAVLNTEPLLFTSYPTVDPFGRLSGISLQEVAKRPADAHRRVSPQRAGPPGRDASRSFCGHPEAEPRQREQLNPRAVRIAWPSAADSG